MYIWNLLLFGTRHLFFINGCRLFLGYKYTNVIGKQTVKYLKVCPLLRGFLLCHLFGVSFIRGSTVFSVVREKREKDAVTFLELHQKLSAQVCKASTDYSSLVTTCNPVWLLSVFLLVAEYVEEVWSHFALSTDSFRRLRSLHWLLFG